MKKRNMPWMNNLIVGNSQKIDANNKKHCLQGTCRRKIIKLCREGKSISEIKAIILPEYEAAFGKGSDPTNTIKFYKDREDQER